MAVNFGWEKTGNSQHGQKLFIAPICTFHRPNDFEMLRKGFFQCNVFMYLYTTPVATERSCI